MKKLLMLLAVVGLVGCDSAPQNQYPASMLDGKPMAPGSWHYAHVKCHTDGYSRNYLRDDGSIIRLNLTGPTEPGLPDGCAGVIHATVPSFEDNDMDSTYFFQKFVPDAKETK